MKKILSVAMISAIALLLSSGCSSKNSYTPDDNNLDAKVSNKALYVHTHDSKKILKAIKKAGEETGWNITEFKSNEVIVEKTEDAQTIFSTVHFSDGHIEFSNPGETSDLRDAIEDELEMSDSSHSH